VGLGLLAVWYTLALICMDVGFWAMVPFIVVSLTGIIWLISGVLEE
jgi:hypothetical protein